MMKREARKALDQIGINIPRIDVPVARLSGGQRQAIAVARTISGDADIILLDEPLAAMGAKEGAMILDLIARLKDEGNVSIIMILHNYVHVLTACDRVNLIQDGVIAPRQADRGDLGRGADRDRRRGVPARPAEAQAGNGAAAAAARRAGARRDRHGRERPRRARDRRRLRHRVRPRAACSTPAPARSSAVSVVPYPSAVIDRELPGTGERLPPDWALQDPDDWVTVLEDGIPDAVADAGVAPDEVVGLGVDFTSCTVLPVTADGTPLCTLARWRERRHAWPKLWKHHAAQPVADRLNEVALERGEEFLAALRRPDLLGVVLPQAHRAVARGPRDLRRLRRLHRGDRLDRLAADRTRGPPERHRGLQGDVVAGRGAAADRVLRGRLSGLRHPAEKLGTRVRAARDARRHAHRRARAGGSGCPRRRRRRRQRRLLGVGAGRRRRAAGRRS